MRYFNKIFFIFIILFFIIGTKSYTEEVSKVKIEGNKRISAETIVVFGDIQIGKDYQKEDINNLIKKLYETTFFSNISVNLNNGLLNILVEENPIIKSLIFNGEKAEKYKEAISEKLTLREKTSYLENYIKQDINIIKEFYRTLGYYFVKIDAEIQKLDQNQVNLIYNLDKGEKAKISKIFFLGDKKIRDKRLRDIITSQESKFWKFLSRNVYLNRARVDLDKRLLKTYYRNKGYYEVNVTSSSVEYSEGEGFVLSYSINAGKRYKFKKISANISDELDKSAFSPLEKEFNKVVGDYYSVKKLTNILEKIDKLSEQKELQFINHSVTETLDQDFVEVKINIFEGQKFTIERIDIVGNTVTNDSVIRGEMIVDEGDPYSTLLINKSINKLKARGIFGKVEKKITEGSSPDLKVLEIEIEEKATGEITAGAGVGTDGTAFMFAISENNWLGRGIMLRTSAELQEDSISGSIAVTNPNYNYSGNSVSSSFDLSSTDRSTSSGYKSDKTGFSLGTEFEQYENIYFSPSITALHEKVDVDDTASKSIKKMEGNFTNLDIGYGITSDQRNQAFQPTDGYRTKFMQELPILQDSSAIMNGFDASLYHGFSEEVIGALKFYARSMHGIDEDVRLSRRLFLPQSKLRGFNTRRVGPKDSEDWVGGNYATSLAVEAQLPKLFPESTRTDISVFLDSGNVWSVDYDNSVDDTNQIRAAIGVSANIYTTIGPLSFTLAQDISKASTDESETFNFRLGTSF